MEFDDDVQLDTSQVSDERGRRFGLPGGGMTLGGGAGVIVLILSLLFGGSVLGGGGDGNYAVSPEVAENLAEECQTGADANLRDDVQELIMERSDRFAASFPPCPDHAEPLWPEVVDGRPAWRCTRGGGTVI